MVKEKKEKERVDKFKTALIELKKVKERRGNLIESYSNIVNERNKDFQKNKEKQRDFWTGLREKEREQKKQIDKSFLRKRLSTDDEKEIRLEEFRRQKRLYAVQKEINKKGTKFSKEEGEKYKDKLEESKKLAKETLEEQNKLKRKITTARINVVGGYVERTGERLGSAIAKQFKKPLLKKPSVSIKTISSSKLLKQYANSNYPMFKSQGRDYSQSQEQIPQDNRSMFFNETFKKEQNTNRGWL